MAKLTIPGRGVFEVDDSVLNLSEPELQAFAKDFAAKLDAEEDVSVFGDIATGVGAGGVGFVQGISELGASGLDLAFDTNYSRGVTESFEELKESMGLVPETTAGEVAEAITNFGAGIIPVVGWLSRANAAAKGTALLKSKNMLGKSAETFGKRYKNILTKVDDTGTRVNRLSGQAAVGSLAAGAADFAVSPDGMHTLSDAFDSMPQGLKTIEDTGLEGREEATRKLLNKLKVGAEGAAFTTAFELLGPGLKASAAVIGNTPGVPAVARAMSAGFDVLARQASKVDFLKNNFTTARGAPREFYELTEDLAAEIDAPEAVAKLLFDDLDAAARKTVSGLKLAGKGKTELQDVYSSTIRFLEGDDEALTAYGKDVQKSAGDMRNHISKMSSQIDEEIEASVQSGVLKQEDAVQVQAAIKTKLGAYLRRLYEGPMNKSFKEITEGADKANYEKSIAEVASSMRQLMIDGARRQGKKVVPDEELLQAEARNFVDEQLGISARQSEIDVEMIADDASLLKRKLKEEAGSKKRVPIYSISDSILRERSQVLEGAPTLRGMKRERVAGKEALEHRFLRTVADMSRFKETSRFYRQMADDPSMSVSMEDAIKIVNDGGEAPMIIRASDEVSQDTLDDFMRLSDAGYTVLRDDRAQSVIPKFGALNNALVRNDAYEAISAIQRNPDGVFDELWSLSLQAKGISQMGMTVLNPIGQMRNFNSNFLALMANGNIMNSADIRDTLRVALGKSSRLADDDFRKMYDLMGELGLRDQSLTMNEYRLLLREGRGLDRIGANTSSEIIDKAIRKVPLVRGAENLYAGVDNFAKAAAFTAERGKYAAALRKAGLNVDEAFKLVDGDSALARDFVQQGIAKRSRSINEGENFLNVLSGDIVKGTMPIYSRVPEVIRKIRRTPFFGNFIAFPAENIRNSTNILDQSLKEMGYKVGDELRAQIGDKAARKLERQIRSIGARRAMGASASFSIIPASLVAAGKIATGMSDEDYENFQRYEVPDYLRGHTLVPLKNGPDSTEYMDLSYMMFYDYLKTPFKKALQEYNMKGEVGASTGEAIMAGAMTGMYGYLEPFASESLITERLVDATVRQGRTATGSRIYEMADGPGEKAQKGFLHVLGGMEPAALKMLYELKSTGFEKGRLVRAFTETPSGSGMEYTIPEELATLSTGLRKLETNKRQSLFYRGSEFSRNRSSSVVEFTRFAKRNDVTQEQVEQQYLESMGDLFRTQQKLYKVVQAYRERGMPDSDIRRALREANIGKRDMVSIMRGEFSPYRVSRELNRDLRDEEDFQGLKRVLRRVDRSRMNDLYRELRGRSLDEPLDDIPGKQSFLQDIENIEEKRPLSSPVASSVVPMDTATGPEASFDLSGLADFYTAPGVDRGVLSQISLDNIVASANKFGQTPQQIIQTTGLQPIQPDASLLGDDPVTIARNMQIAQRTRRG